MTVAIKNDNKAPLLIPSSMRRKAGFKTGQELEIRAVGGVITILPKLRGAGDEYTARQRRVVDTRLARADADIKAGRVYGPFKTAEEMAASIETAIGKLRARRVKAKPAR